MAWYVFALVDAIPSGRAGKGLAGALAVRKVAGAFVVVERRADVPPVEFGSLKMHQDVVARLATRVPAILPVRFGTLLEPDGLQEALQERDDEIADAFDVVRGRVQFTWRVAAMKGNRGKTPRPRTKAATGTAYLRQAAREANPAPPAVFRALRVKLAPMIAAERYQPGKAALPEAMYHLVEKKNASRYLAATAALMKSGPPLTLTGPFPPFAFAPEIL